MSSARWTAPIPSAAPRAGAGRSVGASEGPPFPAELVLPQPRAPGYACGSGDLPEIERELTTPERTQNAPPVRERVPPILPHTERRIPSFARPAEAWFIEGVRHCLEGMGPAGGRREGAGGAGGDHDEAGGGR